MIRVVKGPAPAALVAHQAGRNTYENLATAEKDRLRAQLCKAQGNLCAFCMRRIEPAGPSMKIAHFVPQTTDRSGELDWNNLFAACRGGMGLPRPWQTCDTRQENEAIDPRLHFAELDERRITYRQTGEIVPVDPATGAFDALLAATIGAETAASGRDLGGVLNLNQADLVRARRTALEKYLAAFRRKHTGARSRELLEREAQRLRDGGPEGREQYVGVLLYEIELRQKTTRHKPPPR